jgi:hypothetical protein
LVFVTYAVSESTKLSSSKKTPVSTIVKDWEKLKSHNVPAGAEKLSEKVCLRIWVGRAADAAVARERRSATRS